MAGRALKPPEVTELPSRIRRALGYRDCNQKQMAIDLEISENTLSNIMRGKTTDPGIRVICAMAKYLDVSADFLLGLSDVIERR